MARVFATGKPGAERLAAGGSKSWGLKLALVHGKPSSRRLMQRASTRSADGDCLE